MLVALRVEFVATPKKLKDARLPIVYTHMKRYVQTPKRTATPSVVTPGNKTMKGISARALDASLRIATAMLIFSRTATMTRRKMIAIRPGHI